jgi:predicted alpha/beta hydrolase
MRYDAVMHTHQDIELIAADGYKLAATVTAPTSPLRTSDGADVWIVIGSATAVPRGFYRRFAEFAAAKGAHVIATDYRGIGGSKPASLKGFEMSYADWSRYDLAAAVKFATSRGKAWLVGHSLAGHALGQLPDPNLLQAAIVCAAGAGWHGHMPWLERVKVQLLWHVIGPIFTTIYGYHPMSKLGMGEDLPMGVYREWKRWCQFPHYFFDDPKAKPITDGFDRVTLPIAAINATDDLWALPHSRDAFFKGFRSTKVEAIDVKPAQWGLKAIGHMGYYRPQVGEYVWPLMWRWLQGKGLPSAA